MPSLPPYPDYRRVVADMLSLALGAPNPAVATADWTQLFDLALRERGAALAWGRSGSTIRRHAPPEIITVWRAHALSVATAGERSSRVLADVQRQLAEASVMSVSVKGPVFAITLYGEPILRPMDDLDLFVPAEHRAACRRLLAEAGWTCTEFIQPADWEVFEKRQDGFLMRLDLFSRFPKQLPSGSTSVPDSDLRRAGDVAIRAHAGPSVAPYLAAHLAKHDFAPFLWYIDFLTLWRALSPDEQWQARSRAHDMQLHRYLDWAIEKTALLDRAAAGDARALAGLGVTTTTREQPRSWLRKALLAGSVREALAGMWVQLLPESERTLSGVLRMLLRQIRNRRRLLTQSRPYGSGP